MGLFYKLDVILNALDQVRNGQAELQKAVDQLLNRLEPRDALQEGIENILNYAVPKGGDER